MGRYSQLGLKTYLDQSKLVDGPIFSLAITTIFWLVDSRNILCCVQQEFLHRATCIQNSFRPSKNFFEHRFTHLQLCTPFTYYCTFSCAPLHPQKQIFLYKNLLEFRCVARSRHPWRNKISPQTALPGV